MNLRARLQEELLKPPQMFDSVESLMNSGSGLRALCSCWYGSQTESDAMWRLYCENVGVAITTSVARLKKAVKCFVPRVLSGHFKLSLAEVIYQDSICCGDNLPWLIKRKAFEHEEEVRLYVDYPLVRPPGLSLQIDPRRLIEKITVTPYAGKWQSEAIVATVKKLMHVPAEMARLTESLAVTKSNHMDGCEPSWPPSQTELFSQALSKATSLQ